MARPGPSREEIFAFVGDAKAKKKNKKTHVKGLVEEAFPELKGAKVRRNGQAYDALEYLLSDLDTYG